MRRAPAGTNRRRHLHGCRRGQHYTAEKVDLPTDQVDQASSPFETRQILVNLTLAVALPHGDRRPCRSSFLVRAVPGMSRRQLPGGPERLHAMRGDAEGGRRDAPTARSTPLDTARRRIRKVTLRLRVNAKDRSTRDRPLERFTLRWRPTARRRMDCPADRSASRTSPCQAPVTSPSSPRPRASWRE